MAAEQTTLGPRLKTIRERKGLSLDSLAEQSGIAASILTEIESDSVNPPLGTLITLARTLNVSVGEIIGNRGNSPFCIVRKEDRQTVDRFDPEVRTTAGYSYQSLGLSKEHRRMEPYLVTLSPVDGYSVAPNKHAGEEILFVLEGQVKVTLEDHTDILQPGDSIYYDSTLEHTVTCHGETPATILAVVYLEENMVII